MMLTFFAVFSFQATDYCRVKFFSARNELWGVQDTVAVDKDFSLRLGITTRPIFSFTESTACLVKIAASGYSTEY
jgi:hypothetical protein